MILRRSPARNPNKSAEMIPRTEDDRYRGANVISVAGADAVFVGGSGLNWGEAPNSIVFEGTDKSAESAVLSDAAIISVF